MSRALRLLAARAEAHDRLHTAAVLVLAEAVALCVFGPALAAALAGWLR